MKPFPISLQRCLVPLMAGLLWSISAPGQQLLDPASQPKFVHPLPIPAVLDVSEGPTTLSVDITQVEQDLGLRHPQTGAVMKTTVWGYNGQYPGPTIFARKGVPLQVYWHNRLTEDGSDTGAPLPHLLPVDPSLHWALGHLENWQTAGVPIVTHLHGGHTESASDGLPEAWYTPNFAQKGHHYVKGHPGAPYYYHNTQEAATIWYHDHALGITRLNVYAGLAGFYLLTDEREDALKSQHKLPAAPYDLGLAIQDRMFTADGQLYYPSMPEENGASEPSHMPEFFGNFILVNGKIWPVLDVEPRQYRLRLLNGSDSRFYNLFFSDAKNISLQFWQIGSDLGFLPSPVAHDQLLISPGERMDVMVDFSDPALWGQTIILRNNARAPYPFGETINPRHEGQIMAIRVSKPLDAAYPLTPIPASLRPALPQPPAADKVRELILFEGLDEQGRLMAQLGTLKEGAMTWDDPITENPALNATEIWEIYNLTPDAHPIHLHLVSFRVLNTQKFKAEFDAETGVVSKARLLGQPKHPGRGQDGLKDTYPIMPGEMARFIATFDRPGRYVWHCHILSHEDHEMMRPYHVGEMPHHMPSAHNERARVAGQEAYPAGIAPYSLYPNPGKQAISLQVVAPEKGHLHLKIYDLQGRLVLEQQHVLEHAGEHLLPLDTSSLQSGLYTCVIQFNTKTHRERFMITR
ncbi:multicopper oxidase domain-containing protein [Cesiribacter andamanensis]|uniref:Spore coat protein A n=1 Tax=Cesiribacter andamanensis AMV16 TaxID=1279009 RepID=M7N1T7_9BACT|nr:multicopper oxidase domain-containing protein [Cesiribacter andamanensis]EMR01247.1 Spore coat protein A [Cesiribacter andamanensis AMV16]